MNRKSERKPFMPSGGVRLRPSTRAALRRTRLRLSALEGRTLTTEDVVRRLLNAQAASIRMRASRRGFTMPDLDAAAGVEPEPVFQSPPASPEARID